MVYSICRHPVGELTVPVSTGKNYTEYFFKYERPSLRHAYPEGRPNYQMMIYCPQPEPKYSSETRYDEWEFWDKNWNFTITAEAWEEQMELVSSLCKGKWWKVLDIILGKMSLEWSEFTEVV